MLNKRRFEGISHIHVSCLKREKRNEMKRGDEEGTLSRTGGWINVEESRTSVLDCYDLGYSSDLSTTNRGEKPQETQRSTQLAVKETIIGHE